jgi:hypothetical protein
MDALLTRRQMAQQMVDAGGDSGMVVTENHPQLLDGIEIVCTPAPIAGEQRTAAATRDLGQGPLKQRALQTRPWLAARVLGQGWLRCCSGSARASSQRRGRSARQGWSAARAWHRDILRQHVGSP